MNSRRRNAIFFGNSSVGHAGFTVVSDVLKNPVAKFVFCLFSCLLKLAKPLAVFWGIAFVVVNSIYCFACRPMTHIGQKVFKRFPSVAHSNTPTPVPLPLCIVWVGASLPHFFPSSIRWRLIRHAVRLVFARCVFCSVTAARFCASLPKFERQNFCGLPTITKTSPKHTRGRFPVGAPNNSKSVELFPHQIYSLHINPNKGTNIDTLYITVLDFFACWVLPSNTFSVAGR